MKYEYEAIPLATIDANLGNHEAEILNKRFKNGWEYVDSISQGVSSGGSSGSSGRRGTVIAILRKEKENITL